MPIKRSVVAMVLALAVPLGATPAAEAQNFAPPSIIIPTLNIPSFNPSFPTLTIPSLGSYAAFPEVAALLGAGYAAGLTGIGTGLASAYSGFGAGLNSGLGNFPNVNPVINSAYTSGLGGVGGSNTPSQSGSVDVPVPSLVPSSPGPVYVSPGLPPGGPGFTPVSGGQTAIY